MGETVTIQKNWQELIRPNKLQVTPGTDANRFATLVAEPLERGFGQTLGNALRRILLSSLQGAAVQSVHIDGVLHEFSSIAGVREDVTDIVLNIKDISIKMQGEGPKRMVVKKQGPGVVTAGDIQTVGDVVVLNPDSADLHARRGRRNPHGVHGRRRQLPSFPGIHPYNEAYASRMLTYGTTCHFIVPDLDAGNQIIYQSTFTVPPGMKLDEIIRRGQENNEPHCLVEGVPPRGHPRSATPLPPRGGSAPFKALNHCERPLGQLNQHFRHSPITRS